MQCLHLTRGDAPSAGVTVTLSGSFSSSQGYVTIDGTKYKAETTLTVPNGTEITVTAGGDFAYGKITMNGTSVGTVSSTTTTYTFQATDNVLIAMESLTYMYSATITMPYTG